MKTMVTVRGLATACADLRERAGMTWEDLAAEIGVSVGMMYIWQRRLARGDVIRTHDHLVRQVQQLYRRILEEKAKIRTVQHGKGQG